MRSAVHRVRLVGSLALPIDRGLTVRGKRPFADNKTVTPSKGQPSLGWKARMHDSGPNRLLTSRQLLGKTQPRHSQTEGTAWTKKRML